MIADEDFVGRVRTWSERCPNRAALVFYPDRDVAPQTLSFAELDRAGRALAGWLRERLRPGDRALLLYPPGLEFVTAFIGCLYAGIVAVPAPGFGSNRGHAERTAGIALDAGVSIVLTTPSEVEDVGARLAEVGYHGEVAAGPADDSVCADPAPHSPHDIAFLQYTSGSTSDPRGVMVTHANLTVNLNRLRRTCELDAGEVVCGWLPHFHDMGLILMLLLPLYCGATTAYMAPTTFLRRPAIWLETISRHQASVTVAPDFAYRLCTKAVTDEQLAALDLSSLRWAVSGAEPVRVSTLQQFSRRFRSTGLRHDALAAGYGLAEFTLLVTATPTAAPLKDLRADPVSLEHDVVQRTTTARHVALADCGPVDPEVIRIVDPERLVEVPEGNVGEIWLRGDDVAVGYWRRPELTAEVFRAHTTDDHGPYLRTGDLGAVVDGGLYITGRRKDLLVINGRNLYPQDLEHHIRELHPALVERVGVVFPVDSDHGERIVVVHEVKQSRVGATSLSELATRIQVEVAEVFGVPAPGVVLTRPGGVLRTTSGKVQRQLMRALFLQRRITATYENLPLSLRGVRQGSNAV